MKITKKSSKLKNALKKHEIIKRITNSIKLKVIKMLNESDFFFDLKVQEFDVNEAVEFQILKLNIRKDNPFEEAFFINADIKNHLKTNKKNSITFKFIVFKNCHPYWIEILMKRINNYHKKKGTYYIFAAPCFLNQTKDNLKEVKISWIDESGNADIRFGKYHILVSGKGEYTSERKAINPLFSKKGALALYWILHNPTYTWSITELVKKSGISVGQAFNIKELWAEFEWISKKQKRYVLEHPKESIPVILEMWQNFISKKKQKVFHYFARYSSFEEFEESLIRSCSKHNITYALTGSAGLKKMFPNLDIIVDRPYYFYIENKEKLELIANELEWKHFKAEMSISAILPNDTMILKNSKKIGNTSVVSDIQLFLDQGINPIWNSDIKNMILNKILERK